MRSSFSKITFTSIFIHQYQVSQNPSNLVFIISAFYTTSSHCILQKHKDSLRIQKRSKNEESLLIEFFNHYSFLFQHHENTHIAPNHLLSIGGLDPPPKQPFCQSAVINHFSFLFFPPRRLHL